MRTRPPTSQASPTEMFVVFFPCGAYYVARTEPVATSTGIAISHKRSCCIEGHVSFKVERWKTSSVVLSFTDVKREPLPVAEKPKPVLRLVKP